MYVDILACNVGGQLDDYIHERGPAHVEGLDSLLVISDAEDDPLPPLAAGGKGPEPALNGLKVVPECPRIHGVLGCLILSAT